MSKKTLKSIGRHLAVAALLVSVCSAEELVCQGQWNGAWIDVLLKVDDRSGKIMGLVTDLGDRDRVAAAIMGQRLPDGSFRVGLSYRFEHFGTFHLKQSSKDAWMVWETEDKTLWFSPLGKIPPDRLIPPDAEDEGEARGMRESPFSG